MCELELRVPAVQPLQWLIADECASASAVVYHEPTIARPSRTANVAGNATPPGGVLDPWSGARFHEVADASVVEILRRHLESAAGRVFTPDTCLDINGHDLRSDLRLSILVISRLERIDDFHFVED